MRHRDRRHRRLIEALEPRQFLSTVTVASAMASESDSSLTFHVSLDAPADHDVTLNYVTTPDGTASVNKDYTLTRGKLTLPAGETSADITVDLKNDFVYESTESFRLNLTAAGAKLAKPFAKGTITDDDVAPSLTFKDVTTKEGNAGQHVVTLNVSLSAAAGTPITLKYATSDDTPHFSAATAGTDYTAAKGTLTFLPGQTKKTIQVFVKGDTLTESAETFRVTLSHKGNDVAAAQVTIKDDDKAANKDAPLLSLSDVTALEGDAGTSQAAVTVTLSKPSDKDVTFRYSYPGPANSLARSLTNFSSDYVPASGTITIPAGQTSATIPVTLLGDTTYEDNQTFQVHLSNVKNARPINGRSTVSSSFEVVDDEPVLYADATGTYVAGISGLARSSDHIVSLYDTGAFTVPVVYSQTALVAPAGGTLNFAPRFPETSLITIAPNAYALNGSTVTTGLVISGLSKAGTGALALAGGTLNLSGGSVDASSVQFAGSVDYMLIDRAYVQPVTLSPELLAQREAQFGAGAVANIQSSYGGYGLIGAASLRLSGTHTYTGVTSISAVTLTTNNAYYGDANVNGGINADDYALIDRGYGAVLAGISTDTTATLVLTTAQPPTTPSIGIGTLVLVSTDPTPVAPTNTDESDVTPDTTDILEQSPTNPADAAPSSTDAFNTENPITPDNVPA